MLSNPKTIFNLLYTLPVILKDMIWDYRLIVHDTARPSFVAVHEVYYDARHRVKAWTEHPIDISGDTPGDVEATLKHLMNDLRQPPLILSELEALLVKR